MEETLIRALNDLWCSLPNDDSHNSNIHFKEVIQALPPNKNGSVVIQCEDCGTCYMEYEDGTPEFCPNCES